MAYVLPMVDESGGFLAVLSQICPARRRAGELLRALERAEVPNPFGAGGKSGKIVTSDDGTQQISPYAAALVSTGLSRQAAHRYQQLAGVPKETFERHLDGDAMPTSRGILRAVDGSTRMSNESLWVWGEVRDWERESRLQSGL